jgi:DNA replication protein DnaC
LIEASEPQTKESPIDINLWADWLRLNHLNDPQLESMVAGCARFIRSFRDGQKPRWLTILGSTGTGKTHCAKRVWDHLKRRVEWGNSVYSHRVIYWPSFVSELRSGDAYDKLRDMMKWPVLFLDDICAERDTTGFASEQLNTLIGCRTGRWTIITSNLMLDQVASVEPRMADRMIRQPNMVVELDVESYNLRTQ